MGPYILNGMCVCVCVLGRLTELPPQTGEWNPREERGLPA